MDGAAMPAVGAAERRLVRLGWALLAVGVAWRLTRYLLRFPIWGDEAMNCFNLVGCGWADYFRPLPFQQVAPLLFWWLERLCLVTLGPSELSLRLPPLLAGLTALLLFPRLARLTLPPAARPLAVGLLAVAIWPVSMCTLLKPYAFDLLAATALLLPAVEWLHRPERTRWLLLLTAAVPVALLASYPAVFVAGSVGPALLPLVWRRRRPVELLLFAAFNVLTVAAFYVGDVLVARMQLDPNGPFAGFLRLYWADGFPPAEPLPFLKWAVLIHTGRLMAYPVGGSNGLSAVTLLFFLAGVVRVWRERRLALLALLLGPFALGFVAAVLGRYPYGGCCRLSQHVAPAICLLAGLGLADVGHRLRSLGRRRLLVGVCGLLLMVGVGGVVRDVIWPYRDESDQRARAVARRVVREAAPDDRVVLVGRPVATNIVLRWYLCAGCGDLVWSDEPGALTPGPDVGRLWCVHAEPGTSPGVDAVRPDPSAWTLAGREQVLLIPAHRDDAELNCELAVWTRRSAAVGGLTPAPRERTASGGGS